jgi:biotin-dependent carboxylase-like uncharacterized protein
MNSVNSVIRVLRSGPFTTVQDLGRRGRGHQGVARSGAFDQRSHQLANRIVGNAISAATIEILLGPCHLLALANIIMAVTGTNAIVTITPSNTDSNTPSKTPANTPSTCATSAASAICTHARYEEMNCAFVVRAGETISIGVPTVGLRTYLSIRGGFDPPAVLGSRSYDSLGQIGPMPLRENDELPIGMLSTSEPSFEVVPVRSRIDLELVPIRLGPRDDWIDSDSISSLAVVVWTIDAASNRTGIRFAGPSLRRRNGELPSEAMIPGAVQLPMSGLPIVLGPDGGTTGGYPVIGVIPQVGLDRLAQRRPGDPVRFEIISSLKMTNRRNLE